MGNLKLVGIFVFHIGVGTLLFILVSLAAVLLHLFIDWLAYIKMPIYIIYPCGLLEYFVFALDFVCYIVYCIAEAHMLLRAIAMSAGWQTPRSVDV